MNNPLHAQHYADQAVVERAAAIVENVPLAKDTWRIRIECPDLAGRILPGQFVMVRLHGCDDPLIGRPLALYDIYAADSNSDSDSAAAAPQQAGAQGIDVVYLVKGKLTSRLVRMTAGQTVDVWGPLGNGFPAHEDTHLVFVAGGIGQTPFLAMAKHRLGLATYGSKGGSRATNRGSAERITLCYGARTADLLAGVEDFQAAGVDVRVCTDDGTQGRHGLVTAELADVLAGADPQQTRVICCGPEVMMEAAAGVAADHGVRCEVSLETPMACGIGICFSCVAKVKQPDGDWDYKRTCVDGPVFDAQCIEW